MSVILRVSLSLLGIIGSLLAYGQDFIPPSSIWEEKIEISTTSPTELHDLNQLLAEERQLLLRFSAPLSDVEKDYLRQIKVTLKSYFGQHTYLVNTKQALNSDLLNGVSLKWVGLPSSLTKLSPALCKLLNDNSNVDWLDLMLSFDFDISETTRTRILEGLSGAIIEDLGRKELVYLQVAPHELADLLEEEAVRFLDVYLGPDELLNYETRIDQGVNVLQASTGLGKGLLGQGVVIGVGDGGELGSHVDLAARVVNYADGTFSGFGAHADHVSGTLAGAGHLDPRRTGMAPAAELLTQKTKFILINAENYRNLHGMVLTNNSYGSNFFCSLAGIYNSNSYTYDNQLHKNPKLLHVFAAGNSGWATCGDYPASFRTILSGYQSAKNVLTVGCVDEDRVVWERSSRGPVYDGRIKPEICGVGVKVRSMGNNYNYYRSTGTSMSTPAVTGTLALMIEAYRKKNGGADPDGALLKAIACNTAEDLGNPGPDFTYGFGLIKGTNAVRAIEEENYFTGTVSQGQTKTHEIHIPGIAQGVKVLLHWRDEAGNISINKSLVNDLDLTMLNLVSMERSYPLVLNATAAGAQDWATPGVDSINNIEQIVSYNLSPGTYRIEVDGTTLPFGAQDYVISYELIYPELAITYPLDKDALFPNQLQRIQWEAEANNTATFSLEYSLTGGSSWIPLATNLPASQRSYDWTTPSTFINEAKLRIYKNGDPSGAVESGTFSILPIPYGFTATAICEGYVQLDWADGLYDSKYEVFQLKNGKMVSLGVQNESNLLLREDLQLGERNWFAVRYQVQDSIYSPRSLAIFAVPEIGAVCPWDDDAKVLPLTTQKGRVGTSTALSAAEQIEIPIRNIGSDTIHSLNLAYQLANQSVVTTTSTVPIPSGDVVLYQFSTTEALQAPDTFQLNYWVQLNDDLYPENDSIFQANYAIQLANDPVSLPLKFDFDFADDQQYENDYVGLPQAHQWDFQSFSQGQLQLNKAERSMTLMTTQNLAVGSTNPSLQLTANLDAYVPTGGSQLFFQFEYRLHPPDPDESLSPVATQVWLRGSDQDPWIATPMNFTASEWTISPQLNLSGFLAAHNQTWSTSTQIKIAHTSTIPLEMRSFTISEDNSLPVSLSFFTAERADETTQLEWKTDSEFNNAYFEVQRALPTPYQTIGSFETIGTVTGRGNSNEDTYYHFIDRDPSLFTINYYRLKQIDFDGAFRYSDWKAIDFGKKTPKLHVYPNPVERHFFLELDSQKAGPVFVQLFDPIGKLVLKWGGDLEKGAEKYRFTLPNGLSAGVYTLRVKVNRELLVYRLEVFH